MRFYHFFELHIFGFIVIFLVFITFFQFNYLSVFAQNESNIDKRLERIIVLPENEFIDSLHVMNSEFVLNFEKKKGLIYLKKIEGKLSQTKRYKARSEYYRVLAGLDKENRIKYLRIGEQIAYTNKLAVIVERPCNLTILQQDRQA